MLSLPVQGSAPPSRGLSGIYGVIHGLVDAACVSAVFCAIGGGSVTAADAFFLVVLYDLLAFGSQGALGYLADRLQVSKPFTLIGLGLTLASVLFSSRAPTATAILSGVGNSLFHLGAGAAVLGVRPGRAAPVGIFVAPGALGLGVGLWLGRDLGTTVLWPLVPALLVALVVCVWVRDPPHPGRVPWAVSPRPPTSAAYAGVVVGLLLFSIVIRSAVGLSGCHACPKTALIKLGIPAAAFAGKLIGGLVADRWGFSRTAVTALVLSAPLIAFGGREPLVILPGLLLFQMTMPVTLAALGAVMRGFPAAAFGLSCVALILGALPTFVPLGRILHQPLVLLGLVLASAGALHVGLLGFAPASRAQGRQPLETGEQGAVT